MSGHDAELESLRAGVSCAVLLERLPPPWQLDQRESTQRCLKYRRGAGEVLIVNHDGQGWWDPMSRAKGDVFTLAQHLDPGLNLGQVRRLLRPFIGLSPSYPALPRRRERQTPPVPVAQRWARRAPVRSGSPAWDYLTRTRALPEAVVLAAIQAGVLREGPHASAWFAHLDHAGRLTGIEMRGPAWRSFSPGGSKTLFRLPGSAPASTGVVAGAHRPTRLAITEAPIEAMSLAALEGLRADTLYLGVAGGIGPETITALQQLLGELAGDPAAVLVAAMNNDAAGQRYADQLYAMWEAARLPTFVLAVPPAGHNDFNDVLRSRQGRGVP